MRQFTTLLVLMSCFLSACSGESDANKEKDQHSNNKSTQTRLTPSREISQNKAAHARKITPQSLKKPHYDSHLSLLENIKKNGELVVLTRNAPTTYYFKQETPVGFEHDLVKSYAQSIGVKTRFVVLDTVADILRALDTGKGHIAAAGLTAIQNRREKYLNGPAYFHVQQQMVCRQGGKRPRKMKRLKGVNLVVISNSSYVAELEKSKKKYPKIQWTLAQDQDTEDLLEQVWKKKIDCTIADSNIVAINRRYYPELVVTFNVTKPQPLVWYYPKNAKKLHLNLETWFKQPAQKILLTKLNERYYGYIKYFNYVNTKTFQEKIPELLPKFKNYFELAAKKYRLDWTLLAAQGYQESQWNPNAKSPTGVRGLMMLTKHTAREMDVKNRLDPQQSILGGAGYFIKIKQRLPKEITGKNRIWIALAAYNIGLGHIYDARRLARRLNKNPNTWIDVKKVLPLLHKKRYYKSLRYGYARGSEPVRYVARIRDFHDMLLNFLSNKQSADNADTE